MNLRIVLLSNIEESAFLNHPVIQSLKGNGCTFNFRQFYPLEPQTAFSYVLTGCNPGKTLLPDVADAFWTTAGIMSYEQTVPSVLQERGCSVEFVDNNVPEGKADFTFIYMRDINLLYEISDGLDVKEECFLVIAPAFEEYVQKCVNINNFLKQKEIIETNSNGRIRWKDSLAYHTGNGALWINLIGREAEGAVSPGEEYGEVREALIKGLTEKLIDSEGQEAVVDRIFRKEELFSGDYLTQMPDLMVSLRHGYAFSCAGHGSAPDTPVISKERSTAYTAGGGIALGQHIRKETGIEEIRIADVAPSILHYAGSHIPSWMDGKVEERLFNEEFLKRNPPQYDNGSTHNLSREDEALIKERLKGLGYL